MEGNKIYEESKQEISRALKSVNSSSITINLDKLDGQTKLELTTAIQNTLYKRSREIDSVILGVQ